MRILIVDDDEVCTTFLSAVLKPYGECFIAHGGEQAISMFTEGYVKQHPFDLVCLDIEMPILDGQVTLRCLRAIDAGFGRLGLSATSLLMASSHGDTKNISEAFNGQCDGFVVKPYNEKQIVAQLTELGIKPVQKSS